MYLWLREDGQGRRPAEAGGAGWPAKLGEHYCIIGNNSVDILIVHWCQPGDNLYHGSNATSDDWIIPSQKSIYLNGL